jgi:hypothetical protein
MSKTVLILFAACTGLSLLSLHLVQRMRASQAEVTQLQAQVAKLEQQQQTPPPPAPAPAPIFQVERVAPPPPAPNKETSVVAQLQRLRPASEEATFANGPSREERMRMVREARERQRQLMQDPDYREAMRVQHRSNMVRQYPGLAQELNLTAEQTEQLFDLLADQQMRNNEQAELLWDAEGLDPAALQQRQEKMAQRWGEIQQKTEAELAAQLGPDKLQAWKEYQSTLGARHQAEQLKTTLAGRGVPLSEDANRAVVKAYAEAQKAEMQEYANMANAARVNAASSGKAAALVGLQMRGMPPSEMYEKQIEHAKKRNQRVLEAVSPFLSYEQREALQKEQEAELKMQEAQMRIMRAQSNVDGGTSSDWVSNSVQSVIIHDR